MALQYSTTAPMIKRYVWPTLWSTLWASFGIFFLMGCPSLARAINLDSVITDAESHSSVYASSTLLFVNPAIGDDHSGTGTQRSPLRSLTHALAVAEAGTIVILSPGIYSTNNGEQFPIQLKSGVTVQGDPNHLGEGILLQGGGGFLSPTFARQDVTLLGADEAVLMGVTVTNPNSRGYGLWIESTNPTITRNTFRQNVHDGISITGASQALIQGNYFYRNGANGVTVYGTSQPDIQGNVFEETGFGINMGQQAAPRLLDNRIWNNRSGIVVQGEARPSLRRNVVEFNEQDGLVAIAESQPNLGLNGDPGQNRFSGNGQSDINAEVAIYPIIAVGNTLDLSRVVGQVQTTMPDNRIASFPNLQQDATSTSTSTGTEPPPVQALVVSLPRDVNPSTTLANPSLTVNSAVNVERQDSYSQDDPSQDSYSQDDPSQDSYSQDAPSQDAPSQDDQNENIENGHLQNPDSHRRNTDSQTLETQNNETQSVAYSSRETEDFSVPEQSTHRSILSILAPVPETLTPEVSITDPNQLQQIEPEHERTMAAPELAEAEEDARQIAKRDLEEGGIEIPIIFPGEERSSPPLDLLALTTSDLSSRGTIPPQTPTSQTIPNRSNSRISSSLSSVTVSATPAPLRPTNPSPSTPPDNLLPVPGTLVPEGHLGNLSTLPIQSNNLNTALLATVPFTPTSTRTNALRYRVLVEADTYEARNLVNSIVPDAFFTQVSGRSMMQIGAYHQLDNANDIAYQLVEQGLKVEVQRID